VTKKRPTPKKPTAKKRAVTFKKNMTVDEIFAVWEASARNALKPGQSYDSRIFDPQGAIVKRYKTAIQQHISDTSEEFTAADFRNSTQVATDIGRMCSVIAESDPNHVVSLDVFQRAAKVGELHPSCPRVPAGSGRWCEV
jgi:hypothetical protein